MKKTVISLALAASLPSLASEYHGSLSGMSGAAYSTGHYSEGVLLNPSLGASYDPEKDDFALLIGAGAVASDEQDLIDQADDLADLIDEIEGSQFLTNAQATELKRRLTDVDGDTARIALGGNLAVSLPTELVSLAFIMSSRGNIFVTPDVTDSDLALVDRYLTQNLNPSDLEEDLDSTITARGAVATDMGISFSKSYRLQNGDYLLVGFKPKRTEVESIIYTENVADFDEDDFDSDDYTFKESATNFDAGFTYLSGKMRYGFVANNLQNKKFKTINPNEFVSIERQLIGSAGYVDGPFKAELAYDLNAVPAIGLAGQTQMLRLGIEYTAWEWLRLRTGLARDQKDTMGDSYSFGIGVGAFNLAYISGSEETEGVALSGGVRF